MPEFAYPIIKPLASRLVAMASSTSGVFWTVGLVLLHVRHPGPFPGCPGGGADTCGLLSKQLDQEAGAALALVVLVGVTSGTVLAWAKWITHFLTGQKWRHASAVIWIQRHARKRVVALGYGQPGGRTRTSPGARSRVDRYPHATAPLAPTRFGNVFAAMKQRILCRYQIRIDRFWTPFKLGLARRNEPHERELRRLSAVLVQRVEAMIWTPMMGVWAGFLPGWQWLVAGLSACGGLAYVAYRLMCHAACGYCDFIEDMMRMHPDLLYELHHLAPPVFTADLKLRGEELTRYHDTGDPGKSIRFVWERPSGDKGNTKS